MAKIQSFKALRPVRDKVHLVATRPYYSYKKNVLKAKLQTNPFTFLRIINPEFGLPKEERHADSQTERFQLVKQKYKEFIEEGILKTEKESTLYLYRQIQNGHSYVGIIAGASVEEYNNDLIKKHEATITAREEMFTDYLDIVGYNAEPVLLCHEPSTELDVVFESIMAKRSEYEFTTTDSITHEMWVCTTSESQQIESIFEHIPATYIADGHHRSASSAGLFERRNQRGLKHGNESFFLSFLIDETKLKIFEYNRLVKNHNNTSEEDLIKELTINFAVTKLNGPSKPQKEHQIVMMFGENWYLIECKSNIIDENHPVKCLDAEILTQFVLSPILQIHDLKTDRNIDFISGVESLEKMSRKMIKGNFDIAFILYPVRMDQVKKVADNQMIMPPKSTWVEPKMRSGLTIYNINE
jgi:uncharacterized protein (DUF1015 family)